MFLRKPGKQVWRWVLNLVIGSTLLFSSYATAQTCLNGVTPTTPTSDFTIHGDGTVTHKRTELMWDRCAWGQSGENCENGSAGSYTFDEAQQQAVIANKQAYKGYTDWRVPTKRELLSLVEYHCHNSAINTSVFSPEGSAFWSSSQYAGNASEAWMVWYFYGNDYEVSRDDGYFIRLVRGGNYCSLPSKVLQSCNNGATALTPEFELHDNGTTTHSRTALMWDRCVWGQSGTNCEIDNAGSYTWENAQQQVILANQQNYKGYNDWRLPTAYELLSITEQSCYNPAINTTAFPATPSEAFWSGSLTSFFSDAAWMVYFGDGFYYANFHTHERHIRLVRGEQSFCSLPAVYSVTLKKNGNGTISGGGRIEADSTVNLSAIPDTGYIFNGWTPAPCDTSFTMPGYDLTCTATFTKSNQAPVANFTATPTTGTAPLIVNLIDNSYDPDGSITKREWFVNGVALTPDGSGLDKSMTFNSAGTYKITLTVTDDDGAKSNPSAEQTVVVSNNYTVTTSKTGTGSGTVSGDGAYAANSTVTLRATPSADSVFAGWGPAPCAASFTMPQRNLTCTATFNKDNQPPVATFTTTPTTGPAPLTINLIDSSYDPDGTITKREWFVNGTALTPDGSGLDKSMTFNSAGTYKISLIVTDDGGLKSNPPAEQTVTVSNPVKGSLSITPTQKHFGTMPVLPRTSQSAPRRSLRTKPSADYLPGRVIVGFRGGFTETERQAAREYYRAEVLDTQPSILVELWAVADVEATLAIHADAPNIALKYIEPDYFIDAQAVPNDAQFGQQWALGNTGQQYHNPGGSKDPGLPGADINVQVAWDALPNQNEVVCAVLDTGVDYNHPDLAANMWRNPGEIPGNGKDDDNNGYIDDVFGWDFVDNDNDPMDDHGHGTHVAGTMAAVGNNGIGVSGINWTGKIMALRWMKNNFGRAGGSSYDAVRAIKYVTQMGVKCSNNSWGVGADIDSVYEAIQAYQQSGGLFVAAAGNSGLNNDKHPLYPASYALNNIISVCASDNRDCLAAFSHYGAVSVDLCAPGVDILSTEPGGLYGFKRGTSMAAPHVAGASMLLWSARPDLGVAQIKALLMATVDEKLAGWNYSGGRMNLGKALTNLAPPQTLTVTNTGTTGVTISQTTLSNTDFKIIANTCTGTLPAGGTCKVTVSFLPVTDGAKQASLSVTGTDGSSASATLSGTALAVEPSGTGAAIDTVAPSVYYPSTGRVVLPSIYIKGDTTTQYNAVLCFEGDALNVCDLGVQTGDANAFNQAGHTILDLQTGLLSIPFLQILGTENSRAPGMGNEGFAVELNLLPTSDGSIRFGVSGLDVIW